MGMNEILKKRIEEEAEDYAYKEWAGGGFECASRASFNAGAEFALSHQWIRVEEALSAVDETVIVTTEENPDCPFFCHRSNSPVVETDEDGWCNYTKEKIIAWMPIPELNKK